MRIQHQFVHLPTLTLYTLNTQTKRMSVCTVLSYNNNSNNKKVWRHWISYSYTDKKKNKQKRNDDNNNKQCKKSTDHQPTVSQWSTCECVNEFIAEVFGKRIASNRPLWNSFIMKDQVFFLLLHTHGHRLHSRYVGIHIPTIWFDWIGHLQIYSLSCSTIHALMLPIQTNRDAIKRYIITATLFIHCAHTVASFELNVINGNHLISSSSTNCCYIRRARIWRTEAVHSTSQNTESNK